jgi:hypothetical protein
MAERVGLDNPLWGIASKNESMGQYNTITLFLWIEKILNLSYDNRVQATFF